MITSRPLHDPAAQIQAEHGGEPTSSLDGGLAASLERIARLAATLLHAPAAVIALLGDDRRCFGWGDGLPDWYAHDVGVLVRSGLSERIGGPQPLILEDIRSDGVGAASPPSELAFAGVAGVPLIASDGRRLGMLCAIDPCPRQWSDADVAVLNDLAATATIELDLRCRLDERMVAERELRHNAMHDALTGLPNRALFMEQLERSVNRTHRRPDDLFAVLFLDLDNFKIVNDSVGHHAGDALLVTVARRLEQCMRGGDIVARLGGDEFAILLEHVSQISDTAPIAERIQRALAAPIDLGGYQVFTSVSIGVALSTSASELPDYLLRSADMAMYRAKRGGRARFEFFDPGMHAEALRRLQMETDLRRALERGEFCLYYQPIVAIDTGHVAGVEALLRWRHPERGLVLPADFVPLAEETGLILPLGTWVLSEACRQIDAWRSELGDGAPLTLGVNLSVKQCTQRDLVRQVSRALEETAFDPARLRLEITESAIMENPELAAQLLTSLKALGVHVHLDDFGTGYSSLSYLHRLPLDAIKIDRSFVSRIDAEPQALHLVRTILTLARNLGLETVAEGVATAEQWRQLRELGCTYGQGFLFSPPLHPNEMTMLLHTAPAW
ncbi:MAG TPA: EAL domain-containing protein [Gemmatimonadaceae bacterium]|nr:EAL domain-containing protein [Gemmatimonadaceae bacterium]